MSRADTIVEGMKELNRTDIVVDNSAMMNVLLGQIAICLADIADILEQSLLSD